MKPKSLVNIEDYSKNDIMRIIETASKFKHQPNRPLLKGMVCGTLFLNLAHAHG